MRPAWQRELKLWLPPIAWAAVIFLFSSDHFSGANTSGLLDHLLRQLMPGLSASATESLHMAIRKLGHFSEYFILAVLLLRALRGEIRGGLSTGQLALGFTLTALYAVSDEWHQAFVPSRSASIIDVLIDICGGSCGIIWFHWRHAGRDFRRKLSV